MSCIKLSLILFIHSAVYTAENQNKIPKLTAVEQLVYSNESKFYWNPTLSTHEYFHGNESKLRELGKAPNKIFRKHGLFMHPLQERSLPKTICLVQRLCYEELYKGTITAITRTAQKLREKVSWPAMLAVKDDNDALETLNKISTRLSKNFHCTDIELALCFKQHEYPEELINVLYQYYAISIPIQDIITCAQYGKVWMERCSVDLTTDWPVGQLCNISVLLIKYGDFIVPMSCPVIKKVLEDNNRYDVLHKANRIRFDGEVHFRNALEYHNDSVPHIMRSLGVNPETPTDSYEPAHRKISSRDRAILQQSM